MSFSALSPLPRIAEHSHPNQRALVKYPSDRAPACRIRYPICVCSAKPPVYNDPLSTRNPGEVFREDSRESVITVTRTQRVAAPFLRSDSTAQVIGVRVPRLVRNKLPINKDVDPKLAIGRIIEEKATRVQAFEKKLKNKKDLTGKRISYSSILALTALIVTGILLSTFPPILIVGICAASIALICGLAMIIEAKTHNNNVRNSLPKEARDAQIRTQQIHELRTKQIEIEKKVLSTSEQENLRAWLRQMQLNDL